MSKIEASHLKESLDKFGQCQPIVVNTDQTIIGGHQRLQTLSKMGHKEVFVSIPDRTLDEKEVEELNIRLNKISGNWNWDILANQWDVLDLVEWGFEEKDFLLDKIFPENEQKESTEQTKSVMTLMFNSVEDLQDAENRIATILDEFEGSSYKKKLGK